MSLATCPECRGSVSDQAQVCPHCGYPLRPWRLRHGFEYKSLRTFRGWPLVHIATGTDPQTGRPRIARGVFAIGSIAIGGFALGGASVGVVTFGGLSFGLMSYGGFSVGLLLAIGGFAAGAVAVGGAAFGYLAIGGGAFGVHALGGNRQDAFLIELFRRWFGSFV